MKCPCQGCPDREVPCHAKCEKYDAWKAERDAKKKIADAEREKDYFSPHAQKAMLRKMKERRR